MRSRGVRLYRMREALFTLLDSRRFRSVKVVAYMARVTWLPIATPPAPVYVECCSPPDSEPPGVSSSMGAAPGSLPATTHWFSASP